MAPKKAMKYMKKATGVKKPALGKAKAKALGKAKALEKAEAKKGLNKKNLDKLGNMSLEEKVQAATKEGTTPEEQAIALKQSLTKDEHSQVWGRFQTYLKNNPLEKGSMEGLSKKEKGMKAAQWLMETGGKKYMHVSREVAATENLKKGNTWESEKQMLDKFGWEEMQAHIGSGRIVCRQDPSTPNVWQYKDTQAWSGDVVVARRKRWQEGQEMEPGEEEGSSFNQLYNQEAMGLSLEDIAGSKGKGFGKGKDKGKGKGFGKGKLLAIKDKEDEEEEEEEEGAQEEKALQEALKKARKARDGLASAASDLEEALEKASPKLSRQGKASAQGFAAQITKTLQEVKQILGGKKHYTSARVKAVLEECAKVVRGAKNEAKELKQLACKEPSVASSKRSKAK